MSPSRALQTFEGEAVTVTFDPSFRKRWIRPDAAAADEVEAAVAECPSGALRVRREGASAAVMSADGEVTITADAARALPLWGHGQRSVL